MAGSAEKSAIPDVVGIGESLFDVFPNRSVLGGAPLNFTVHAHELLRNSGRSAVLISRVGDDELGKRVLHELDERGVSRNWVQIDTEHPTGRSIVTIDPSGEPRYEIVADVAWDYMAFDEGVEQLAAAAKVICFNTLSQRNSASRGTVERIIEKSSGIRLFDINIRQSFYDRQLIESGFRAATHAKLNRDETQLVCRFLELGGDAAPDMIERTAERLIELFELQMVAVTRGEKGTVLFTRDAGKTDGIPVRYDPQPNADTVGAGDACNAGLAVGLLLKWDPRRIVSLANDCGAFVASQPGATPRLPAELLQRHGLA